MEISKKTVVYSCSGCSSAGQMANHIAVHMDKNGFAEMSCIAGIGGGVAPFIEKARRADVVVGIDGCPLRCVEKCLAREGLPCTFHYDLSKWGISKKFHEGFDEKEAASAEMRILMDLRFREKKIVA